MCQIKNDLKQGAILKALSWKEPYGSLMLCNKIETRTWQTNYRGLVLICCSKTPYKSDVVQRISRNQFLRIRTAITNYKKEYPEFKRRDGMAIAIGRLVDCRPMKISKEEEDKCFIQYTGFRYCHIYTDVTPIVPFPWKGSLGWKNVSQEIINQIQFIK